MNDWGRSVLDQYDLEFDSIRRGKGVLCLTSGKTEYCLMPFKGSEKRLFEEAQLLDYLYGRGHLADCMIKTREGGYVARNEYQDPFTLRLWHPGDECVSSDADKLIRAVKKLARLHIDMKNVPEFEPPEEQTDCQGELSDSFEESSWKNDGDSSAQIRKKSPEESRHIESCEQTLTRHTRELKKIRTFVQARKSKNTFETQILESFPYHSEQAKRALAILRECGYERQLEAAVAERAFIHGTYNYHFVYLQKDTESVVNFSKYAIQVQILDLYEFIRKTMEKNNWDLELGKRLIDSYCSIREVKPEELMVLYACLLYPDKYWKQLNTYFTSNKVWIPLRNQEKLSLALCQSELRENFVKNLSISFK